jgi:hypothetical protein
MKDQFLYYTDIYVSVFQDGIWRRSLFPEELNLQQQRCVTLKLRIPKGPLHWGSEIKKLYLFLSHFVYLASRLTAYFRTFLLRIFSLWNFPCPCHFLPLKFKSSLQTQVSNSPTFLFPLNTETKIHSNMEQIYRFYEVLYLRCQYIRNTGFVSTLNQPMLVRYDTYTEHISSIHPSIHQSIYLTNLIYLAILAVTQIQWVKYDFTLITPNFLREQNKLPMWS